MVENQFLFQLFLCVTLSKRQMRLPHAWHTSCPCLNVWNSDHWPPMDSSHCLHSWFTRWVHSFYQVGGSSEARCSMISFHDMTWTAQIEDCCKHGKGVKEAEEMTRALSLTCELQIELGMLTRYVPRNQHLACLSKGLCNRANYWCSFLLLENNMAPASSAKSSNHFRETPKHTTSAMGCSFKAKLPFIRSKVRKGCCHSTLKTWQLGMLRDVLIHVWRA